MLSISPCPETGSGALVAVDNAAIAACAGFRLAVLRVSAVRKAVRGDRDSGGMRKDGSEGIGMAVLVIGSTNVPFVPTGASESLANCSDLRFDDGPCPIRKPGCGTPARL